jgi:hypothetical protein
MKNKLCPLSLLMSLHICSSTSIFHVGGKLIEDSIRQQNITTLKKSGNMHEFKLYKPFFLGIA